MNEEMTNVEEIVENENIAEVYDIVETPEEGGLNKVLVGVGVAAVAAGVAIWRATKDKREAWQIKRLEKKGYVISRVIEDESDKVENVSEDEESEE